MIYENWNIFGKKKISECLRFGLNLYKVIMSYLEQNLLYEYIMEMHTERPVQYQSYLFEDTHFQASFIIGVILLIWSLTVLH